MSKLPSFQFYPGDWLRDNIAGCSLAAQGLWLRMMIVMHDSERYGYLQLNGDPMHPDSIARRCGCKPEEYDVLLLELSRAGIPSRTSSEIIFSRRMVRDAVNREANRVYVTRHREKAKAKVKGRCKADVRPMKDPSSSSSSSSIPPLAPQGADVLFQQFWEAYPHKVGKGAARRAWEKIRPDPALVEKMLRVIEQARNSEQWQKESGKFIPHPATWLNQERWEDEVGPNVDPDNQIPHYLPTSEEVDALLGLKERT